MLIVFCFVGDGVDDDDDGVGEVAFSLIWDKTAHSKFRSAHLGLKLTHLSLKPA